LLPQFGFEWKEIMRKAWKAGKKNISYINASHILAIMICVACDGCRQESDSTRMPAIAAIQKNIADADKSPEAFYLKKYAPVEPRYWSKIAAWMVEDSIERNYIQQKPASAILDIGCGYGTLLSFAADIYGASGACMDVVPYLQPKIMQKHGLSFYKGNIEKDPLPSVTLYDIIIMTEVLEHLNFQPLPTLKKIHESLRDGGTFFLSTPDADGGWGRTNKYYSALSDIPAVNPAAPWIDGHIWQYNRKELEELLYNAGFEILRIDHSNGLQGKHFNIWAVKRTPS
jgi:SAM-dependent methyltransferase